MVDGQPAIYNGLYQVCINGGWIQQKSLEILGEALDRYDVDGCFFNNFLNPEHDYAGRNLGICHCDNCQTLYQQKYGRPVPKAPDADYRVFMRECGRVFSEKIIGLMRDKRPSAALVGGTPKLTDIVYGESSTGLDRPLPLWPYTASDNVNKWRNSYPQAGVMCQSMQFLDFAWLPWDIGALYHRHSLESHRGLLTNLVDRLLPRGRDVRSNAHPSVAITLMRQHQRHLVHLVNLSGHSDTVYFEPVPMRLTEIQVRGSFSRARAVKAGEELAVGKNGPYTVFELPYLEEYELIELT